MDKRIALLTIAASLASAGALAAFDNGGSGGDRPEPPSFSEMDQNGDGVLNQDELKGPMQKDFSQIDADSNGELTEQELNTFMENHRLPEFNN